MKEHKHLERLLYRNTNPRSERLPAVNSHAPSRRMIEASGITKSFGRLRALDGFSVKMARGPLLLAHRSERLRQDHVPQVPARHGHPRCRRTHARRHQPARQPRASRAGSATCRRSGDTRTTCASGSSSRCSARSVAAPMTAATRNSRRRWRSGRSRTNPCARCPAAPGKRSAPAWPSSSIPTCSCSTNPPPALIPSPSRSSRRKSCRSGGRGSSSCSPRTSSATSTRSRPTCSFSSKAGCISAAPSKS